MDVDIGDAVRAFNGAGFKQMHIKLVHLNTLVALERLHGDPFDRMIIAQAICSGLTIMTTDSAIRRYPVKIIDCR